MAEMPKAAAIVLHLELDADSTEAIRAIAREVARAEIDAYITAEAPEEAAPGEQVLPAPVDF